MNPGKGSLRELHRRIFVFGFAAFGLILLATPALAGEIEPGRRRFGCTTCRRGDVPREFNGFPTQEWKFVPEDTLEHDLTGGPSS